MCLPDHSILLSLFREVAQMASLKKTKIVVDLTPYGTEGKGPWAAGGEYFLVR